MTADTAPLTDTTNGRPTHPGTASSHPRYAAQAIRRGCGIAAHGPYPSKQAAADACDLIALTTQDILATRPIELTVPHTDRLSTIQSVTTDGAWELSAPLADTAAVADTQTGPAATDTTAVAWVMTSGPIRIGFLVGPFESPGHATAWLSGTGLSEYPTEVLTIQVLLLHDTPVTTEHGSRPAQPGDTSGPSQTLTDETCGPVVVVLNCQGDSGGEVWLVAYGPFFSALQAAAYCLEMASMILLSNVRGAYALPLHPAGAATLYGGGEAPATAELVIPSVGPDDNACLRVVLIASRNHPGVVTAVGCFADVIDVYAWYCEQIFAPDTTVIVLPLRAP
jgi:hypothetical protein